MKQPRSILREIVTDLYWEYDRMSSSGQETLDVLAKLVGVQTQEEMLKDMEKNNEKI